jgi:DNA polymerase-3 subunit gamma/tau
MTDFLFSEDNSAALLLFDEILNRGFDGQHFISGLAAHFRQLLMAQNGSTVKLMEVSDVVKQRFLEQAKKSDKQLLLRGLELSNQCDFNYKLSQNKRLSVEICLMQINGNYIYKQTAAVRQSREK